MTSNGGRIFNWELITEASERGLNPSGMGLYLRVFPKRGLRFGDGRNAFYSDIVRNNLPRK